MELKNDSWDYVGGFGARSRDMLAAVLDQSVDCVKIMDLDGTVEFMNRNGRCAMEIDDFAALAGKPWVQLWPEESQAAVERALADARDGKSSRFEAFCPTAKGAPRWWDVSVTPVAAAHGEYFAVLAVSRDVSERRQTIESLETMAHEMRHRLRNAYAVSGAIALASGREAGQEAFAAELTQRLNTLSAVQASLIDPEVSETLPKLVARIAGSLGTGENLIEARDLPEIELGEQAVRLLALVLGELGTNSLKHGALKAGTPVSIAAYERGATLVIEWREPLLAPFGAFSAAGEGSGQRLMQRMARAHGGTLDVSAAGGELTARLEMRCDR